MRELKFKVWDKHCKRWLPTDSYHIFWLDSKIYRICIHKPSIDMSLDSVIIQQYTGLKDKNGKEIYEGDIVKIEAYRGTIRHVQVRWESVDGSDDMGTDMIGFPRYSEYGEPEVIGNIFENSELLKQ